MAVMRRHWFTCLLIGLFINTETQLVEAQVSAKKEVPELSKQQSVLLAPWSGPYGGVPPWNLVREDEFLEAFEAAISEADSDIERICLLYTSPSPRD